MGKDFYEVTKVITGSNNYRVSHSPSAYMQFESSHACLGVSPKFSRSHPSCLQQRVEDFVHEGAHRLTSSYGELSWWSIRLLFSGQKSPGSQGIGLGEPCGPFRLYDSVYIRLCVEFFIKGRALVNPWYPYSAGRVRR